MQTCHVHSLNDLDAVADAFVKKFPVPAVFAVVGEMGAGKTTFIKKICEKLGTGDASSPTYSLVNEYATAKGFKIFHFDLYRLNSLEEALDMGFEDYLEEEAYIFIEWPDVVKEFLEDYHSVTIAETAGAREIIF